MRQPHALICIVESGAVVLLLPYRISGRCDTGVVDEIHTLVLSLTRRYADYILTKGDAIMRFRSRCCTVAAYNEPCLPSATNVEAGDVEGNLTR